MHESETRLYRLVYQQQQHRQHSSRLKSFQDIPSEIIELPDFPSDFSKQNGAYEAISIVRQRLWERARELNSEWTFMCDADHFIVSTDILDILGRLER